MPQGIQLSRAKGWRLPTGAVKVDRTSQFGNPYCVGEPVSMKMVNRWGWNFSPEGRKIVCVDASEAVTRFEHCLQWDEAMHDWLRQELGGKDLACWCALDQPCHRNVLLRIANSDKAAIRAANDSTDAQIMEQSAAVLRYSRS